MPLGNSNTSRAPAIFVQLNSKTGSFVTTDSVAGADGKKAKHQHTELSGVFVRGISLMDNKNFDKPDQIDKVIGIRLRDASDGQEYVLKASPSALTSRLLGLVNAADLTKPVTLQVGAFAAGTKKTLLDKSVVVRQSAEPFLIAAQNGEKVKAKWSDDAAFVLPKTKEIQVPVGGGKFEVLKTSAERDEWMLNYASELDTKVKEAAAQQAAPAAKAASATPEIKPADTDHANDVDSNINGILGDPMDDVNAFLDTSAPSA